MPTFGPPASAAFAAAWRFQVFITNAAGRDTDDFLILFMTLHTAPAPPLTRPEPDWQKNARSAWVLVKETATLIRPSAKFLTTCEARTYAYSVAANAILALVPFLVLLVTIAHLTESRPAEQMIYRLVAEYLPAGAVELKADLVLLTSHRGVQAFSLVMLAIASS